MLKRTFLFLFTVILILPFTSKAQVYEKGDILVDAYYGVPNLMTGIVKTGFNKLKEIKEVEIGSSGPFGIKGEYLISERIGVGLNFNYATTTVSAVFDRGADTATVFYTYKASIPRFRIMPTVNFHLGNSTSFDPYFSIGFGYRSTRFIGTTDDPILKDQDIPIPLSLHPFAFRAEFGCRYFFTQYLGAHAQIGISGGPLLAAGLSAKF